jgi:glucokinase
VPALTANDLLPIGGPPPDPKGVACVLGLGTGIGEALLVGDTPVAGEGGHADFAPWDPLSSAYFNWLHDMHGDRVTVEDAFGGRAIADLIAFVAAREPLGFDARRALQDQDPAVVLVEWADRDPACAIARDLLLSGLGAEAGNMALRHLPRRGVYLVGGLARALQAPLVARRAFDRGFALRGRMSSLVQDIPRFLVVHPDPGLVGAVACALQVLAA